MTAADAALTAPTTPRALRVRDRVALAALLGGVRVLQALPDGILYRVAAGIGTLAWLGMPTRRALVRANLGRVCRHLAETGQATPRTLSAARNAGSLDRLVRSAFQHWVRAYAEGAVVGRYSADDLRARVTVETPETESEALGAKPVDGIGRLLVGFHFGAIELGALYASRTGKVPVSGPMETVENPVMRAYFERTRRQLGIGLLSLDDVANELTTRLAAGETVALVADRAIRGAGSRVELFGAPTRLPLGPAVLTADGKATTYVVGLWRTGWGRWMARLDRIDLAAGLSRRERLRAALDQEARLLERMVAKAPEQWWSLFFPIWDESR